VGLVLFILLAAATFVPWIKCERCWKYYSEARTWANASEKEHPEMIAELERNIPRDCSTCGGRHRVNLYHVWFEPARSH